MSTQGGREMPHLFAGVVALALAGIILFAAERIVIYYSD
jgi:hypothetical protein